MSSCCTSGFSWHGHPQGHESKIFDHDVYIAGEDDEEKDVAILFLHDIFGWTFGNNRLLADHFAKEVGGRVFVVDLWVVFFFRCFLEGVFLGVGGWRFRGGFFCGFGGMLRCISVCFCFYFCFYLGWISWIPVAFFFVSLL